MRIALCLLAFSVPGLRAQDAALPPTPPPAPAAEAAKPQPYRKDAAGDPQKTASANAKLPSQYLLYVAEAMKSFQARDFPGAIAYADRADAILPPTVWTLNVRGAVAIEELRFEEGLKYCQAALKLDPTFFPAKFNLFEIPFLQKRYAEARKGWEALLSRMQPEDPTSELLTYRVFLTFLLEGDMQNAKTWLDKLPFPSQTPAYQYAHAAWERKQGNLDKWREWIKSAEFIWPLQKRSAFADVLLHLKWLQTDAPEAK